MRTKSGRGDVLLVCMVLFLVVFGLAVLYSTGSYNGSVRFGDAFYYMKKQFFAAALGMLAMYLISCMDYHIFEKYAIAAYLISLALSTLVLFAGNAYNGSRRWLSLGPLSFQPSEFAKLAVILFLARMVGRQKKKRNSFLNLVFVIALVLPIVALCTHEISLGSYLFLGKGEERTGGRNRDSIVSDAMESVIGAIYLDGGFASAKEFIHKFILKDIEHKKLFYDSKTILQEIVQSDYKGKEIEYVLTGEIGPDHDKKFVVSLVVGDKTLGEGTGRTKKAAEQEAAYRAIIKLKGNA